MLLCKQRRCYWYTVYVNCLQTLMRRDAASQKKGTTMSNTASIGFAPSHGLFGRLIAAIDRLLMSSARVAIRNGDLPYFGL